MKVVSYGGGTNSKAMLVGLRERDVVPDLILFADTGGEKPHTYQDIEEMRQWCRANNFPDILTVKRTDKNGDIKTLEQDCLTRNALPSIAYGFKTCSQGFKIQPQEKFLNNWPQAKEVWDRGERITKLIGFDADEPQRAKYYEDKKYVNEYPLLEWDWGRDECVEAIKREGLTQPGKSACFFCPNSRPSEVRELQAKYPELALRAVDMEQNADLHTISGLGRNWAWKDCLATPDMFDFPAPDMPCECTL